MRSPGPLPLPRLRWHGALAVLALAMFGWAFVAWIALDMDTPISRAVMPMSAQWSASNAAAIAAMWATMMAAMMLPSSLPMVSTFSRTGGGDVAGRTAAFVAAYLAVWASFSLLAVLGQWALQRAGLLDSMMLRTSPLLATGLLLLAGAYQFTPLKRLCLAGCRSPVAFLLAEWRPGVRGAWTMGLRHGTLCVGCCWGLMALLFVGGVMNLPWVVALALAVAFEKLLPGGERVAPLLGWVLIAAGLASFVLRVAG